MTCSCDWCLHRGLDGILALFVLHPSDALSFQDGWVEHLPELGRRQAIGVPRHLSTPLGLGLVLVLLALPARHLDIQPSAHRLRLHAHGELALGGCESGAQPRNHPRRQPALNLRLVQGTRSRLASALVIHMLHARHTTRVGEFSKSSKGGCHPGKYLQRYGN